MRHKWSQPKENYVRDANGFSIFRRSFYTTINVAKKCHHNCKSYTSYDYKETVCIVFFGGEGVAVDRSWYLSLIVTFFVYLVLMFVWAPDSWNNNCFHSVNKFQNEQTGINLKAVPIYVTHS